MAKVLASIKVFPAETTIPTSELKNSISKSLPSDVTVQRFEEEPIAFGLVALVAHILMPEELEGTMDKIEESLRNLPEVSEIQVLRVSRY